MHEPDDLSDEQREALHTALIVLTKDLARSIEASRQGSKPVKLDQSSIGRLTRMDAIQGQQMAKASLRNMELRLNLAEQAIKLIGQDRYGLCRRCEQPIGYLRLRARPETPFCLICQSEYENR